MMNEEKDLENSIDFLAEEFGHLDFTFHRFTEDGHDYLKNLWPGGEDERVMVCVYRGTDICEPFHRHDFIYFNYAYKNDYSALSDTDGNLIRVREGECYIGQPFSGYALRSVPDTESTIVGVLIKKEAFFRDFMQTFSADNTLFHFFLDPEYNRYADRFLHFSFGTSPEIRPLLELMIIEYANRKSDTQQLLTSLATALCLLVARTWRSTNPESSAPGGTANRIIRYIADHFSTVSLKELSERFSYHPNYISSLLRKETGKTFSEIVLETRMEHALVLMKGTDLSNEEIAALLGYGSTTNYYKAFQNHFGTTPRNYYIKKKGAGS